MAPAIENSHAAIPLNNYKSSTSPRIPLPNSYTQKRGAKIIAIGIHASQNAPYKTQNKI
jgi:hypothetical protein